MGGKSGCGIPVWVQVGTYGILVFSRKKAQKAQKRRVGAGNGNQKKLHNAKTAKGRRAQRLPRRCISRDC